MRQIIWILCAILFLFLPVKAQSADLEDAFQATIGQAHRPIRQVTFGNGEAITYRLDPLLLVHIGGQHYALIMSESFDGAHWATGAVAVSYLAHDTQGWRLIQAWYEFEQPGSWGIPFYDHQFESFDFNLPFFAGTGEYCGMGACTGWYSLIGLPLDRPAKWGNIPAGGAFKPDIFPLTDGEYQGTLLTGCGGYEYSSVISAPKNKGDVMQVTYSGWMIPGGSGQKRRNFKVSTEVSQSHGRLKFTPKIQVPNCGS